MATDYIFEHQHLETRLTQLARELPGPMIGFARLHKKPRKTARWRPQRPVKEMMARAIGIVVGCEGCIAYHAHDAAKSGATRPGLLETIGVALLIGGSPGSVCAADALDAVDQFLPELAIAE